MKDIFSAATETGNIPSAQLLVIVLPTIVIAAPLRGSLNLTSNQKGHESSAWALCFLLITQTQEPKKEAGELDPN